MCPTPASSIRRMTSSFSCVGIMSPLTLWKPSRGPTSMNFTFRSIAAASRQMTPCSFSRASFSLSKPSIRPKIASLFSPSRGAAFRG